MNSEVHSQALLVVCSIHHGSTKKIAETMADVLDGDVRSPTDVEPEEILSYRLIGFGSGIYGASHHDSVLKLAHRLPSDAAKSVFLFSTAALTSREKMLKDHASIRRILESKGCTVLDNFSCRGFNTNSFMRFIGGMNKGRPNAEDLDRARSFAINLKKKVADS